MQSNFKPNAKSFKKTFCLFQEVELDNINNLKLDYESESGSRYYYSKDGMYRLSNHWGRLANSKWHLIAKEIDNGSKYKLGFANYGSFYADNDFDQLYYLQYNVNLGTITYNHKNNPDFDNKAKVRSAPETRKRIKQARSILNLHNWAKYYKTDIEVLKIIVINELIFTNKSLDEIKQTLI